MPRIIRRALYQKLRDLPEMKEFQRDFELMSGMKLAFVDELGLGDDLDHRASPLCAAMRASEAGRAMCSRSRHALLAKAGNSPACMTCDAGLNESMVPLNVGGIRAGYFVFGGTRSTPPGQAVMQKSRHLLRKNGISFEDHDLEHWMEMTREVPILAVEAYQRIVFLVAKQIALKVTDQLSEPEHTTPPAVLKACGFIRSQALVSDIHLGLVARHCGVSTGHLSRVFHHSTGLTFREYVTQVRLEHAKGLLLKSGKGVIEIAYESGFQSLSQFHRVFLKSFGTTPGKMRSERGFSERGSVSSSGLRRRQEGGG